MVSKMPKQRRNGSWKKSSKTWPSETRSSPSLTRRKIPFKKPFSFVMPSNTPKSVALFIITCWIPFLLKTRQWNCRRIFYWQPMVWYGEKMEMVMSCWVLLSFPSSFPTIDSCLRLRRRLFDHISSP